MITNSKIGHYGRLGNQMFQYSLLYSVGKKNNYEIVLPIENQKMVDGRFNPVINSNDRYGLDLFKCFDMATATCASNQEIQEQIKHNYREQQSAYNPDVFDVQDGTDFEGYFQYWKFFEDYFDDIKREFEFTDSVKSKACDLVELSGVDQLKSTVSVHIRRGDGLMDNGQFQVFLGPEYYHVALQILKSQGVVDPQVIVFSDDIGWCKQNLSLGDMVFVDSSSLDDGHVCPHYIDLCLMSMCQHNIMANSTYSWWGSFLNKNTNSKVVVPKEWWGWGNRSNSENYLRLDHWISI